MESVVVILVLIAAIIYIGLFIFHEKQNAKELAEKRRIEEEYGVLTRAVLSDFGFSNWNIVPYINQSVTVKSRQALENYDDVKYFKEDKGNLPYVENILQFQSDIAVRMLNFLSSNKYSSHPQYNRLKDQIRTVLKNANSFRIRVTYISSAGNHLGTKDICIRQDDLKKFRDDPSLLMTKAEFNKYQKEQQKEALDLKHHEYYDRVNEIIDFANDNKESLIVTGSQEKLDVLIAQLFDRTVNSIKKIKTLDSEEWDLIDDFMSRLKDDIDKIIAENRQILNYYASDDFLKIKETCEVLMSTQREFNEYINEKVQSISQLFGTRVVRNETVNNDEYHYIRPYKKTITPFVAEVSAAVFASAENNPMEYIVKYFYPNKKAYPDQIRKLYHLVEELETLRDAKQIIENYKAEYQQYLGDVPDYIMTLDEAGFYSRLGFASIDEATLTVEYKFSYTSNGGMAQRFFTVPMTEENIAELIKVLESKLTATAFAKEQRNLMTKKLRDAIKTRDNFTCCSCGNSTFKEPNLLLEIDHIIPVAKGGCTVENNLQTLCWKCNRAKGAKILN